MTVARPFRVVRLAVLIAAVLSIAWPAAPLRADDGALAAAERAAIEAVIRDYLRQHPEAVIEAIRAYQSQQEALEQQQVSSTLRNQREALERDPATPVAGNPDGDVTIVEFFDYRCGYCKRVLPAIQALLTADRGVRYVFKEFPILGPESVTAAKASLAVWKTTPERYLDFHAALLSERGTLSEDRILRLAGQLGLDAERIRTTMAEPWVEAALQSNYQLARSLKINGTPAFVIGDQVLPGAISLEDLKALVERARTG